MKFKISKILLKITFLGGVLVLLSLFTFSFIFLRFTQDRMRQEILEKGLIFAEFVSNSIQQDYVRSYTIIHSPEGFDRFKREVELKLNKNKDVIEIALVGINGKILFDSDELEAGRVYEGPERFIKDETILRILKNEDTSYREIKFYNEKVLEIFTPVKETSGMHVVSMRYIVSYNSLKESVTGLYYQIFLMLIPVFLFVIVLTIPFSMTITSPIVKLKDLTKKISGGNLDIKIETKSKDEIGELALAFSQMTSDLKKSRERLEEYSKILEIRVAARTRELKELTESLDVQVKERTKEIQEKMVDLERFRKLAVGRELKMIELKKEIEKFKGRK